MATPDKNKNNQKPQNPNKNAPAGGEPAKTDTAATPAPAGEAKLSKRVTFWSQVAPAFNVRVLRALADAPDAIVPDHGGKPMLRRSGRPVGGAVGKAAKEAREKQLAAMTEEQKVAFLAKERETKKAKKAERKGREREALKEQLRKELEAELKK